MGVKKATKIFSTKSLKKTTLAKLRQDIIKEKGADSDYKVIVAVDVSIHQRLPNRSRNPTTIREGPILLEECARLRTDPAASPKDALMMDDDSSYDDEMASKDDDTSETSDN